MPEVVPAAGARDKVGEDKVGEDKAGEDKVGRVNAAAVEEDLHKVLVETVSAPPAARRFHI